MCSPASKNFPFVRGPFTFHNNISSSWNLFERIHIFFHTQHKKNRSSRLLHLFMCRQTPVVVVVYENEYVKFSAGCHMISSSYPDILYYAVYMHHHHRVWLASVLCFCLKAMHIIRYFVCASSTTSRLSHSVRSGWWKHHVLEFKVK